MRTYSVSHLPPCADLSGRGWTEAPWRGSSPGTYMRAHRRTMTCVRRPSITQLAVEAEVVHATQHEYACRCVIEIVGRDLGWSVVPAVIFLIQVIVQLYQIRSG